MNSIWPWLNPFQPESGWKKRHWFPLLTIIFILAGVFAAGTSTGVHVEKHLAAAGYNHGAEKLPAAYRLIGGPALPQSYSLTKYVQRIHNQGAAFSCVGQTLSQITEIELAERGIHKWISAGFIWNQVNGGIDQGTSYDAAFGILTHYGDAPLSVFSADGTHETAGIWPGDSAFRAAYPYRAAAWKAISPADQYTIEYEISHGHPLALAAPWFGSLYNHWGWSELVQGQSGGLLWWHSVTGVAYDRNGVWILNSWGPQWGRNGYIELSWNFLASLALNDNATFAESDMVLPFPKPSNKFPGGHWYQYLNRHHIKRTSGTSFKDGHGHRTKAATTWLPHDKRLGGIVGARQEFRPKHGQPYVVTTFQGGQIYTWQAKGYGTKILYTHWHS